MFGDQIQAIKGGGDLTNIERMQCGAISGLFAQSLTYPLEVTRRRMQTIGIVATSGNEAAIGALTTARAAAERATEETAKAAGSASEAAIRAVTPDRPPTMASIVGELYEEQGYRGFFKGLSLNWFKGPIAFSISFTCFDVFQGFLETPTEQRTSYSITRRQSEVAESD